MREEGTAAGKGAVAEGVGLGQTKRAPSKTGRGSGRWVWLREQQRGGRRGREAAR